MPQDQPTIVDRPPDAPDEPAVADASDVVAGPIGAAWLREPSTSAPAGADLEELPVVKLSPGDLTDAKRTPR